MITLLSRVDSFQNAKPVLQYIRIEAILGNNKFTYISLFIHRRIWLVYPLNNQYIFTRFVVFASKTKFYFRRSNEFWFIFKTEIHSLFSGYGVVEFYFIGKIL